MKRRGRGEGSIYQRADGQWAASLSLGVDAGGKRKRRTLYATTKGELLEKLRHNQHALDRGQLADAGGLTLGAFFDVWAADFKATWATRTHEYYVTQGALYVKPHVGATKLEKINPMVLRGLFTALADAGVSANLQAKIGTTIGVVLAYAVSLGLLNHNPARDVKKPRRTKFESKTWNANELRAFLSAARGDRFEALFILAADSGMRAGELLGLQWQDVDFDGSAANVRRSAQKGELKEPKTAAGYRRIPLSPFTVEALADRRKMALAEGTSASDRTVFCNQVGGLMPHANLYHRHFVPVMVKAAVPKIRFHDIRHSAATLLLGGGVDLATVSARLGHASKATTVAFYAHATDAGQEKATGFMETLLSGENPAIGYRMATNG
jgi:integrase